MHLIFAMVVIFCALYSIVVMVVLAFRVMWLCCLIVAWCIAAGVTVVLAVIVGCQKLTQFAIRVAIAIDDWRWKRRFGEVLPPLPPE
jgi:hypothetical protein